MANEKHLVNLVNAKIVTKKKRVVYESKPIPFESFVVHFVEAPFTAGRHSSLRCSSLLVSEFPFSSLVTENFNLKTFFV